MSQQDVLSPAPHAGRAVSAQKGPSAEPSTQTPTSVLMTAEQATPSNKWRQPSCASKPRSIPARTDNAGTQHNRTDTGSDRAPRPGPVGPRFAHGSPVDLSRLAGAEDVMAGSSCPPPSSVSRFAEQVDVMDLACAMDEDFLEPESDDGCHEYKRHLLVKPGADRFEELVTQLNFRLEEGQGEALYEIGIEDDGTVSGLDEDDLTKSLQTLHKMAETLEAIATEVYRRKGANGYAVSMLVRRKPAESTHAEIRVAIVGNVDSGKSTLLGVLTKGILDNGRGLARSNVFKHKHEVQTGRTSSISHQILGFNSMGEVTNYSKVRESHSVKWSEIVQGSSKVLSFFDLAGHEKYLKTTLFGLTGHLPDYVMLVVDGNRGGIVGMTKEHLGITLALKVPVFVVITKIDACSEHILKQTVSSVMKLLKRPGVRKLPYLVRNSEDLLTCAKSISAENVAPIFLVSCVSGKNLDLLRQFLNCLPSRNGWETVKSPVRCQLDESFMVTGVGTVVAGTMLSGTISSNHPLLLGPDSTGAFKEVLAKSVFTKRVAVKEAWAGQSVSIALKGKKDVIKKKDIRKGMVLVDKSLMPRSAWYTHWNGYVVQSWKAFLRIVHRDMGCRVFEAEVLILVHPTTMKQGYTPVIHCLTIRQSARILHMDKDILRTGDRAIVRFQWMYRPEYVTEGSQIVFREGRTKGIGTVTKINHDEVPMELAVMKRATTEARMAGEEGSQTAMEMGA